MQSRKTSKINRRQKVQFPVSSERRIEEVDALLKLINTFVTIFGPDDRNAGVNDPAHQYLASAYLLIWTAQHARPGAVMSLDVPIVVAVKQDKKNEKTVDLQFSPWMEPLRWVDLARIRKCTSCGKLFYARHRSKQTCTTACGNRMRLKKMRALRKEKEHIYEAARAERERENGNL